MAKVNGHWNAAIAASLGYPPALGAVAVKLCADKESFPRDSTEIVNGMDVRLKPIGQGGARKSVPIKGAKFFIGRAEDCQLKIPSDLVSRHHCVIVVEGEYLAIRDFGSKNGTFVNGEKVLGEHELKPGDRLMIGELEFEIERPVEIGGQKKSKVKSVTEAAARTVEAASDDDFELDDWIEVDSATKTTPEAETQILKNTVASVSDAGDTVVASSKPAEPESSEPKTELQRMADLLGDDDDDDDDGEIDVSEKDKEASRKNLKIVGVSKKTQESRTAATSRDAAGDALRRMFSGRR